MIEQRVRAIEESAITVGSKYHWIIKPVDTNLVSQLAARYGMSHAIMSVLVQRGFGTAVAIDDFLVSSFDKDVPDPLLLKDAQKSIDRIMLAIEKKEKILIFGDYDVDGITSSALMMIGLLPLGAQINFYLPNRLKDGYGLSTKIVERAHKNGYSVIITVDNGITAFEPAIKARELGIDLIITDHHRPHEEMPNAYAIVNPNQKDCPYPFKSLAGVGVTFKVLSLLYAQLNKKLPEKTYELLLLGTVADVVPLRGENRYWVRYGLHVINTVYSLSIQTLKQNSKLDKPVITATDIGFSITPQINALGRLEDPRQGVGFLVGCDATVVANTGRILYELNEARKVIERDILQQIEKDIIDKKIDLNSDYVIVAGHHSWRAGVIGLVASRIVAAYGRPVILLHLTSNGLAKGSCRSIEGFNIFDGLAHNKDLLEQFGGHAMAAGLSLKIDNIALLKARLNTQLSQLYTIDDLVPKYIVDATLQLSDINKKLLVDLAALEPFGCDNSEPVFMIRCLTIVQEPIVLKNLHVKIHIMAEGIVKSVIFFNRPELYSFFIMHYHHMYDILVRVQEHVWQGVVSVQLIGIDVTLSKEVV